MPVNQFGGIQTDLPGPCRRNSASPPSRTTTTGSRACTRSRDAFEQVTANMALGMQDHNVPPKYLLEKVLAQVKEIRRAEAGRLAPGAATEEVSRECQARASRSASRRRCSTPSAKKCCRPTCASRAFSRSVTCLPAGPSRASRPCPNGAKYYQFLIHQSTTTDLTADQIHQIGLDEVKRDEAEMLAIAQEAGLRRSGSFRASLGLQSEVEGDFG